MTAAGLAAVIVVLLDLYVGTLYCIKLIRRQTRPRIATWLIFEVGVMMSLAVYFTSRDHSVAKAALNITDAAVVTAIVIALLLQGRSNTLHFTANERLCLVVALITLSAWAFTRSAWIGVGGFQLVMSIAYVPTIENLWQPNADHAPEPLDTWAINAVAALIGVLLALSGAHQDYIAMLYPLRALVLCVAVVVLVLRWRHRSASTQTHSIS